MNTLDLTDENIMDVWLWCSEAYIQHGIRLKLPTNTNPTKTYQWRYLKSIAAKFKEWQFDESTSKQFIQIALKHCNNSGVLRKGLAALHQKNLLQICYEELKNRSNSIDQSLNSIKHIHKWLYNKKQDNLINTLLYRKYEDEFCNLTKWYNANKISKLYLSLSKPCGVALHKLGNIDAIERSYLPKLTSLYLARSNFIEHLGNTDRVKTILGSDWREL